MNYLELKAMQIREEAREAMGPQLDRETLVQLWNVYQDVPISESGETEGWFLGFPPGTDNGDVLHWFDEQHLRWGGLYRLMNPKPNPELGRYTDGELFNELYGRPHVAVAMFVDEDVYEKLGSRDVPEGTLDRIWRLHGKRISDAMIEAGWEALSEACADEMR